MYARKLLPSTYIKRRIYGFTDLRIIKGSMSKHKDGNMSLLIVYINPLGGINICRWRKTEKKSFQLRNILSLDDKVCSKQRKNIHLSFTIARIKFIKEIVPFYIFTPERHFLI